MIAWTLLALSAALLAGQAALWLRALRRLEAWATLVVPAKEAPPARAWILVAARDEAARLPDLAAALAPRLDARCKLVLVDDGSCDGSAALARSLFDPAFSTVLERPALGKPAALAAGLELVLEQADPQDGVLFTDADCRPGPGWLDAHRAAWAAEAGLVCGPLDLELEDGEELPRRLRLFENMVSDLQCALGCAGGRPGYARGGNWSARAGELARVEAPRILAGRLAGDDVHLVRALAASGTPAIYLLGEAGRVATTEGISPTRLARQARRRYGKLRDLPFGEILRQGGLFAALACPALCLLGWALFGHPSGTCALAALSVLGAAALAAQHVLARGLALTHPGQAPARPLGPALWLALHAARHALAGGWNGYSWRSHPADAPVERTS